ncbi:MAG: T9SS type A sorting domain-containing protein [Bacteroidales bacterium]|nr:T9SS type A sorting domain-containing protein [Bacteroidales bacterium]
MKSFTISFLITFLFFNSISAQSILNKQNTKDGIFVSKIIVYTPAPGQFINTAAWGTPTKAESIIGGVSGGISLGAYGGYIVVGFNKSIENDPENPYGIDFTVFGNPLETWSEPGIIMVMKDENNNGQADDTWYEIIGSDHYWESTEHNYSLNYYNPNNDSATDVKWIDNLNDTGYVYANAFHSQPYYPISDTFPNINQQQYSFSGTYIKGFIDRTIPSDIKSYHRAFGYADNFLRGTAPYDVPDNPYTPEKEGCGGDPVDIDWTVDSEGNPSNLDQIDFVKIYTAINEEASWLGEVSTELTAVMDVTPNTSISGEKNLLVVNDLPPQMSVGKSIQLEANFFTNGIIQNVNGINWSVDNPLKATINDDNLLTSIDTGRVVVSANYNNGSLNYTKAIETFIVAPVSIDLKIEQTEIRVNNLLKINAKVKDQYGDYVYGLESIWTTSNSNISIQEIDNQKFIKGEKEGSTRIYVHPKGFKNLIDSVDILVLEAEDTLELFLTIKNDNETFFPRQKIEVTNFNLMSYVTNPHLAYGLKDIPNITLAHSVASIFDNVDFESDLRFEDKINGDLYISKLPVNINNNITYYLGSGGYADKAWIVKHNNKSYINGFADILVSENDEIIVYYVNDINSSWCLYNVEFTESIVDIGKKLNIQAHCESYNWENSLINSLGEIPVASIPVIVNDKEYVEGGKNILTDKNGFAQLHLQNTGEYNIKIATEEYRVTVENGISGIENISLSVIVSPNPANDYITITSEKLLNRATNISIFSSTGNIQYHNNFTSFYRAIINTSDWNNGLYFIRIKTSDKGITKKIIINH